MGKINPEEFVRALDKEKFGKVSVEKFIQEVTLRKLVSSKLYATRLAYMIDEDLSGDITILELQKTLKSFKLTSEAASFPLKDEATLTFE